MIVLYREHPIRNIDNIFPISDNIICYITGLVINRKYRLTTYLRLVAKVLPNYN